MLLLWSGQLKALLRMFGLNKRPKEKNPRNVKELWTDLKGEWEKISIKECKTLIHSWSKRCQAVIESKGLHIKY